MDTRVGVGIAIVSAVGGTVFGAWLMRFAILENVRSKSDLLFNAITDTVHKAIEEDLDDEEIFTYLAGQMRFLSIVFQEKDIGG